MNNVDCQGTEDSLLLCPSDAIEGFGCGQFSDAGVRCEGKFTFFGFIFAYLNLHMHCTWIQP